VETVEMRTIIDKDRDPENGTFILRMAFVSIGGSELA
jgi:hypothetical protein